MNNQQMIDNGRKALSSLTGGNKALQCFLIELIIHVHNHGHDVANNFLSQLKEFENDLKKGTDKLLVDYLLHHAQLGMIDGRFYTDRSKQTLLEEAKSNNWWAWKKPKTESSFCLEDEVRKILKRAVKQSQKNHALHCEGKIAEALENPVSPDMVTALTMLVGGVVKPEDVISLVQPVKQDLPPVLVAV